MGNFTPGPAEVVEPEATSAPFDAVVQAVGINFVVDVPEDVSEWFGGRGYVAVAGWLDGAGIRATLVPVGRGHHQLYLNGPMRDAVGVGAGSTVHLQLWADEVDRGPVLADDLRTALIAADALDAFLAWPPSHQREYLVTIEASKRPETRAKRIAATVQRALGA
jgi:hypothetical protein